MIVLGIETSCDETAAAVVAVDRTILSNEILSQFEEHRPYGGVVPEIAARAHLEYLNAVIIKALKIANVSFQDLSGIGVTGGPGLIGGVTVGVMTAKAIADVHKLPFLAINHLEGHALSARLSHGVTFPYLLLLVSGGHCQLLIARELGQYEKLGGNIDDAIGEAFDKTAKLLDLGYPGGPAIESAAKTGNPQSLTLPRPLSGRPGCDFSFSGLKTAVRNSVVKLGKNKLSSDEAADIAASFQCAVADVLKDRCTNAFKEFTKAFPEIRPVLVAAGGVASNLYLRDSLREVCTMHKADLIAPPPILCTDNAAMIAWAALEHLQNGEKTNLNFSPRPRWPLEEGKSYSANL